MMKPNPKRHAENLPPVDLSFIKNCLSEFEYKYWLRFVVRDGNLDDYAKEVGCSSSTIDEVLLQARYRIHVKFKSIHG